jgi:hypothetical protein
MDPNQASSEGYVNRITWSAYYQDGTALHQYDGDREHSSEEIERVKLKSIVLFRVDRGEPIITQQLKPGQKLIYRSRNVMRPGQGKIDRIHILGWEQEGHRHVLFVHESDFTIHSGDFADNDTNLPWYYSITPVPTDEVAVSDTLSSPAGTEPASGSVGGSEPPVGGPTPQTGSSPTP